MKLILRSRRIASRAIAVELRTARACGPGIAAAMAVFGGVRGRRAVLEGRMLLLAAAHPDCQV